MTILSKILKKVLLFAGTFFAVTFVIYFFNLDMKGLSAIEPLFLKHYDTMPRNQSL